MSMELDLGLPPKRPRRPFYAGVAMSTTGLQDYGTPWETFDALCRYHSGAEPDAPREGLARPWVDPFASAWNALVPTYFSLPGGGGIAVDGLKQSWRPPDDYRRWFVIFNPVYEDAEEACRERCKKKRCEERGFCLSEYKPGMPDALLKAEAEALAWGGPITGILPARSAAWFKRTICPPREVAGRFLGGEAFPGEHAPLNPYLRTVAAEVYRYERLQLEVNRLAGRQTFRTPPGAVSDTTGLPVKNDSAGFDTLLVTWKGVRHG
jgi:hypothetical protein